MKLTDYSGIEVFVNESGNFFATVSGVQLIEPTFEALKGEIENQLKTELNAVKIKLPCHALVSTGRKGDERYSVTPLTLVGLNRNDSSLKWQERFEGEVVFAVPATDDNLRHLNTYAVAKNTTNQLDILWNDQKLKSLYGGRIQPSDYLELVKSLQSKFEKALVGQKLCD